MKKLANLFGQARLRNLRGFLGGSRSHRNPLPATLGMPMKTVCPSCGEAIDTPYTIIGATVTCGACSSVVIPVYGAGTSFPNTGYEITFRQFVSLLTSDGYRSKILPLVKKWAPEVTRLTKADMEIMPNSSEEKALIEIHRKIQNNPAWQGRLYQAAMSLWR